MKGMMKAAGPRWGEMIKSRATDGVQPTTQPKVGWLTQRLAERYGNAAPDPTQPSRAQRLAAALNQRAVR